MPKIEKDLLKVKGSDGQWHYVPAVGGSVDTAPTWDSVQDKPFSTLGSGLSVDENGVLSAQGGGSANAVQYVAQTLTDEQKKQARANIGASPIPSVPTWKSDSYDDVFDLYDMGVGYGIVSGYNMGQTPDGMTLPALVIFGDMFYGRVDITVYDGAGAVWSGSLNLSSQTTDVTKTGDYVTNTALTDILQNYVPFESYGEDLQEIAQLFGTKLDKNQGAGNAGKILGIGADGIVVPQDKPTYTLPQATADALGGIKADAATAEDTQVVRIGTDGKLRTKPTGGSSITVDSALSSTSENPVQNKAVTAALAGKITAPTTAAVGQIIKVKSVDSTGKPTEWEAVTAKLANPNALTFTGAVTGSYDGSEPLSVEIPSGGGVESWELIADITTTELVQSVSITKDQAGQPLALKKATLMTNTKEERIDEVSYTGEKRIQVKVNNTDVLYVATPLSSADSFRNSHTDLEIKNGQLFGEATALIGTSSKIVWSPVCAHLETETINSVAIYSDYIFVSGLGIVTRFSVGSQFKLYGVRA